MRVKIIILYLLFTSVIVHAQRPCDMMITTGEAMESLRYRPVVGIYPSNYSIRCNVNDSIKNRLLELLNWQWGKQELDKYVAERINEDEIQKLAINITKENSALYKITIDSIIKEKRKEIIMDMEKRHYFHVDCGVTLSSASLWLKESIPTLREALNDQQHYDQWAVELALARLGDETFRKKIIFETNYDKSLNGDAWIKDFYAKGRKLVFMATQESISKLGDWLDTSKIYIKSIGGSSKAKCASDVVWQLWRMLLNKDFQQKINELSDDNYYEYLANDKLILFCKDWLVQNKGKYEINRDFCPY